MFDSRYKFLSISPVFPSAKMIFTLYAVGDKPSTFTLVFGIEFCLIPFKTTKNCCPLLLKIIKLEFCENALNENISAKKVKKFLIVICFYRFNLKNVPKINSSTLLHFVKLLHLYFRHSSTGRFLLFFDFDSIQSLLLK